MMIGYTLLLAGFIVILFVFLSFDSKDSVNDCEIEYEPMSDDDVYLTEQKNQENINYAVKLFRKAAERSDTDIYIRYKMNKCVISFRDKYGNISGQKINLEDEECLRLMFVIYNFMGETHSTYAFTVDHNMDAKINNLDYLPKGVVGIRIHSFPLNYTYGCKMILRILYKIKEPRIKELEEEKETKISYNQYEKEDINIVEKILTHLNEIYDKKAKTYSFYDDSQQSLHTRFIQPMLFCHLNPSFYLISILQKNNSNTLCSFSEEELEKIMAIKDNLKEYLNEEKIKYLEDIISIMITKFEAVCFEYEASKEI